MLSAILAAVLFLQSGQLPVKDPLVGNWSKDGEMFAELRADGTGVVDEDAVNWKADGKRLTLIYAGGERETMTYRIVADSLTVTMDGESETYTRVTAAAGRASASGAPVAGSQDQLSALLLSSSWCSFTFNQISGASRQERVTFLATGAWRLGAQAESYSSGAGGTVAGQSNSGAAGRWQVRGGRLLMSDGATALQDVGLSVSRNSSGSFILKAGNKEYSQCP